MKKLKKIKFKKQLKWKRKKIDEEIVLPL